MSNPTYRKKLIEVALPLSEINDASAYDKMPGIGPHPKGIHHWWARLPLPTARAVLFASLLDDPSSDPAFANKSQTEQDTERERLFDIIRGLLQKKIHLHPEAYAKAYREIARCCGDDLPAVLDPFVGGGSIPLEAQRLGLKAHASDLNPVAVLINKAQLEIVPHFKNHPPVNPESRAELINTRRQRTQGLAEDLSYYGRWILEKALKRIGHLYPKVKLPKDYGGGEANVVAWLWARTVKCPNPACGADAPLVRSFALASKKHRAWIEARVDRKTRSCEFVVKFGQRSKQEGTVGKKGARCIVCREPISFNYIKEAGERIGIGARLLAVVAEGGRRKIYLPPILDQEKKAQDAVCASFPFPDTSIPEQALGFRIQAYGIKEHREMFAPRQLTALNTLSELIKECRRQIEKDAKEAGAEDRTTYADAVTTFLAFAIDRCADFNNAFCRWNASNEKVMNLFGRGAIPMVWDFGEANILANSVGGWITCCDYVARCLEVISTGSDRKGQTAQLDASSAIPKGMNILISTDPPYYDNIGYADLSDFFYVWLRRNLGSTYPDLFSTVLVPKTPELIASPHRFDGDKEKARDHFESGFRRAFSTFRDALDPRYPLTVYYAFRQEEEKSEGGLRVSNSINLTTGWETFLEALISTGYRITGTWPIRASQAWRMRSMGSNALASYIVLVCRPRSEDAPMSTRRDFINSLKQKLPPALRTLQQGNIAPVDLAQSAIGPGMAVFSRYSKVLEADGAPMRVRSALSLINQVLDEYLSEQEGEYDADTRWALAWFEQHGMEEGPFGVAEILSKAKNTAVDGLVAAGIIVSKAGKVRILRRAELPEDWDPAMDKRLTVWEVTQPLIRALVDKGSEEAAAHLLRKVGALGDVARELAYRLYTICDRKKWAQEALAYNSLVVAWPELVKLAGQKEMRGPSQQELTF